MPDSYKYNITCHCGIASQTITRLIPEQPDLDPSSLDLCHCRTCRKTTGLLCTSYLRIEAPSQTKGLIAYRTTTTTKEEEDEEEQHSERLFCGTCGCHVFWRGGGEKPGGAVVWAVATGVIMAECVEAGDDAGGDGEEGGRGRNTSRDIPSEPQYARHINVAGTRDGGLSVYLPEIRGRKMDDKSRWWGDTGDDDDDDNDNDGDVNILPARCHCGNVSFHITRPDESSSVPKRPYTDLIHPYFSTPPAISANPSDDKWWLRMPSTLTPPPSSSHLAAPKPTRYLAGTCSCRPCRLISGFEIQAWAFVPRSNIFLHVPPPPRSSPASNHPLDFDALPPGGVLKSYPSSPHVVRDFCARCGATVFWREKTGAEVVDVSVGLLDAAEGARAEDWLEWWTGRVSFAEETRTGRDGEVAARAEGLVDSLERGMKASARRRC